MVIDLGEAKIFKWQVTKAFDGLVGRSFPAADFFEQLAKGFGVQDVPAAAISAGTLLSSKCGPEGRARPVHFAAAANALSSSSRCDRVGEYIRVG
jgi:hypothetical protein